MTTDAMLDWCALRAERMQRHVGHLYTADVLRSVMPELTGYDARAFIGDPEAYARDEAERELAARLLDGRVTDATSTPGVCDLRGMIVMPHDITPGRASPDTLSIALAKAPGKQRFLVRLDSGGGCCASGWEMARMIEAHPDPVDCDILGGCLSAAVLVAAACRRVRMAERGVWMWHGARLQTHGDARWFRTVAKDLGRMDRRASAWIARRRRVPYRLVRELELSERYLGAAEALELGLVDEVIPNPPMAALWSAERDLRANPDP